MTRRAFVGILFAVATLALPSPSRAQFNMMKIRQVFPGTTALPNAQYIMLQMYSAGQTQVTGHSVTVYDATGAVAATFTFAADVANGANQAYILLATTDAQTLFGISADLVTTAAITPAGGMAC